MKKDDIAQELLSLLDENTSASFVGATLCSKNFWINISSKSITFIHEQSTLKSEARDLSNKEMYLACRLYVKYNKMPNHRYCSLAEQYILDYEAEKYLLAGTDSI